MNPGRNRTRQFRFLPKHAFSFLRTRQRRDFRRRSNRPFLWIQSDVTQTPEYTEGRDRFLARQRDRGTLLTIRKSMHLGFTDDPSYLTSLGRDLVGAAGGMGSISLAEMTTMTGDAISAFVAPALGVRAERGLDEVVAGDPGIRWESRVGRETTAPDASSPPHAVRLGETAMSR